MATTKGEQKYYGLGEKAKSFYCPVTKLKVLPTTPGILPAGVKESKRIKSAKLAGHLVVLSEEQASTMEALRKKEEAKSEPVAQAPAAKPNLDDLTVLTKPQLIEKLKALEGITEEVVKAKSKLNKEDLIDFIEDYEIPEEEEDEDDDDDDEQK